MRSPDDVNAETLRRLFERYPRFESPSDESAFWHDWLDDVRDWPGDLVKLACVKWRNSPAKREPRTAGELRPLIQQLWNGRRVAREKLDAARKALTQRAPDASTQARPSAPIGEGGPWTQFCGDVRRRFGEKRAAHHLHALALSDGVLWTGSRATESIINRDAGDIVESFGWRVEFFPDRFNRLTRDRPPLIEEPPTPEERRMIVTGLRRLAQSVRTGNADRRNAFHARRPASQDERQAQIDDMESDT